MDFILDHMRANGCAPDKSGDIILDDKPHYIRRAGDKAVQKRVSYCFNERGGWYYDHKTGHTFSVSRGGELALTPAEMQAISKVRSEQKEAREKNEARIRLRLQKYIKRAFNNMTVAESHHYLTAKVIGAHGARVRAKTGELVIPMYLADGTMASIQKISIGWKQYQKGGQKQGAYYPIAAKGESLETMVLCEGFATGASIRECTGLPVVVAFDAGNLVKVAQVLRDKYLNARIVIAADNDCHGDKNTGIEKAQQAAAKIGGAFVVYPEFDESLKVKKYTDFNDAHQVLGADYVKNRIMAALDVPQKIQAETPEEAPDRFYEPLADNPHPVGGDFKKDYGDFNMQFRVLGYGDGVYYYFPFKARQIVALTASAHTMQNLLQLDSLASWETRFGWDKASHSKIAMMAANAMVQLAQERGVFKEEDRVRGCGGWVDDCRVVLHCGDALYIDGERTKFGDIQSDYTYVAAPRLMIPAHAPLKNSEAHALRTICESPTWENPLSGSLLAGWLVIAPVCAALQYRPHLYITGEAESGKSTVIERIIKPVLGRMAMCVDGGTTEPAIRQMMGYDARPLVYDEAESSQNMIAVIELARKATTGSVVAKFGQRPFKARFAACFSAINPPVNKTADETRISFMVLKKNRKATAMADFDTMLRLIDEVITDEFSSRLLARTLENMNALIANIRVFQRAARIVTGGARAGQQIGAMLAGLYLLSRTDIVTQESAEEWIRMHDWTDHTIVNQEGDPMRLVQHVASSLVRTANGGAETSIGDLIASVAQDRDTVSERTLRNYGILVRDGRVFIASVSHNLARLLAGTDWSIKWSRTLSDVTGAIKERSVYFARGVRTSAISLPLSLFIDDEQELPL
jgi:putative DNA primase/helicase